MTYHTVAMDNITLRSTIELPREAHETLVVYAELVNKYMEDNKEEIAKAYSDLIIFGSCTMPEMK